MPTTTATGASPKGDLFIMTLSDQEIKAFIIQPAGVWEGPSEAKPPESPGASLRFNVSG